MHDNAIAIYCFLDDYLKAICHREDSQRGMTDAEVMLTAILACRYFGGNYSSTLCFLKSSGYCKRVLCRSRFSRRLNRVEHLLDAIFENVGQSLKQFNTSMEYVMDSFPVRVCHNMRVANNRLLPLDREHWGRYAAKREYFYGFRVQVIATMNGIPVEFAIVPGSWGDPHGMKALAMDLPQGSRNICDSGYTSYVFEDVAAHAGIWLDVVRKSNAKRVEPAWRTFYKNSKRKIIETVFSIITGRMNRTIHATNLRGFLLKVKLFIWCHTLNEIIS